MKSLSAIMLVLGMGSTVFGTAVEFRIGGAPAAEVTLQGSETAAIELWATGLTNGFSGAIMGLDTMPALVEDFTFDAAIPGPNMYGYEYVPGEPGPGANIQMNDFKFLLYTYPYITEPTDQLLLTLIIHCTGVPSETILTIDDLDGFADLNYGGYYAYLAVDFASAQMVITQVPEPATLALVGLGGLALIRRR